MSFFKPAFRSFKKLCVHVISGQRIFPMTSNKKGPYVDVDKLGSSKRVVGTESTVKPLVQVEFVSAYGGSESGEPPAGVDSKTSYSKVAEGALLSIVTVDGKCLINNNFLLQAVGGIQSGLIRFLIFQRFKPTVVFCA